MSIEVGVVLDDICQPIYWHEPDGRSAAALPDSRTLWDVFWENRTRLGGFAHSHPGGGTPAPSGTDLTTFAAIEAGLGLRLDWWILSADHIVLLRWKGPGRHDYEEIAGSPTAPLSVPWISELRRRSGY